MITDIKTNLTNVTFALRLMIQLMIKHAFIYHVKFIPPIPIWAWEIDLSESWLKGICDHAPDEDHMGSELFKFDKCDFCD